MTDLALWNTEVVGAQIWGEVQVAYPPRIPLAEDSEMRVGATGWSGGYILYGAPDVMSTTPEGIVLIEIKFDAGRRERSAYKLRAHVSAGCAGTGGSFSRAVSLLRACSIESLIDHPSSTISTKAESVATPVSELVARIRSAFSLRMTELAAILRVERPTVYAWLRGESSPLSRNYDRLAEIAHIATWWRAIGGPALGNAVRQAAPGQDSLVTMLSREELDGNEVQGRLRLLASQSADIDEAAFAQARARVERRGWRLVSPESTHDRLSVETGQRIGPE
jgi:transcriptional regulator with XRE-family HTH domain